tara:strand:- start:28 stop:279 length:252 start_codon:yes stop_codon:yes gene_type:complete
MNVQEEMDRIFKMQKDNLANERKFKEICKLEITIDKLKGIALDIKLDAANDLGLDNERFHGICEGLDRVINHLEEIQDNENSN